MKLKRQKIKKAWLSLFSLCSRANKSQGAHPIIHVYKEILDSGWKLIHAARNSNLQEVIERTLNKPLCKLMAALRLSELHPLSGIQRIHC
jgi:hypothetical protein